MAMPADPRPAHRADDAPAPLPGGLHPGMLVHERDPLDAETPRAALADAVTPTDAFYVRSHGPLPDADDAWRVRVDGLVTTPLDLTLDDLRARPQRTVTATLMCAGNRRAGLLGVADIPGEAPWGPGAVSTARWTGVRLADVLRDAGLDPAVAHVAFEGPDVSPDADPPQVFGGSVDVATALGDDVLLALGMNGEPLPLLHGGPVRVVVPGHVGARSVKWVRRVTAQREPSTSFFQTTAYRLLPPGTEPGEGVGVPLSGVPLTCAVVAPAPGDEVPRECVVSGYALAGSRRVVRVDVSGDDGATWVQADLDDADAPHAWTRWRAVVGLAPGERVVVARAWDEAGACQPEHAATVWNPKGYVNTSWDRVPVRVRP